MFVFYTPFWRPIQIAKRKPWKKELFEIVRPRVRCCSVISVVLGVSSKFRELANINNILEGSTR